MACVLLQSFHVSEAGKRPGRTPGHATGDNKVGKLTEGYLRAREVARRLARGQTMTEYALILAAVAIVVFVTYEVLGQNVGKLANKVDSSLTTS
jgi:Flp pilus assembly pilin Flp